MAQRLFALFAIPCAAISAYVGASGRCGCHSVLYTKDMDGLSVDFECLGRFALVYGEQGRYHGPGLTTMEFGERASAARAAEPATVPAADFIMLASSPELLP